MLQLIPLNKWKTVYFKKYCHIIYNKTFSLIKHKVKQKKNLLIF